MGRVKVRDVLLKKVRTIQKSRSVELERKRDV